MKIAIDYSFSNVMKHSAREGIFKWNIFFLEALFRKFNSLSVEFWCIEANLEEFKSVHQNIIDKYKKRVSFITGADIKDLIVKVQSTEADVVFVDFVLLAASHYVQKPTVFMLHDLLTIPLRDLFFEQVPTIDKINEEVLKNLSLYVKNGTNFVTSSSYIRNEHLFKYIKSVDPKKTTVIPFPPMIKTFQVENILSKNDFKSKFKISGAYIPYASQNRPNKNLIVFLRALKRLMDKKIKIQLVTTGTIRHNAQNTKYVNENNLQNMIIETGALSEADLYALYKYADMVVVPTIIEGLGMTGQCLEALKIGNIPVIHSKSWGMKESLESVGLSMKKADLNWFDLEDDETLANKIIDVLENPQSHIEKQKHIIDYYTKCTWDDTACAFMKVFKKAINEYKKQQVTILPLDNIGGVYKISNKFRGFYSVKYKKDKKIKKYMWGLYKKIKSEYEIKYYLLGICIFRKSRKERYS